MNIQAGQNAASSAAAEARETAAQTQKEALHGDPQAVRLLAKEQQARQQAAPPAASKEAGVGEGVDVHA